MRAYKDSNISTWQLGLPVLRGKQEEAVFMHTKRLRNQKQYLPPSNCQAQVQVQVPGQVQVRSQVRSKRSKD